MIWYFKINMWKGVDCDLGGNFLGYHELCCLGRHGSLTLNKSHESWTALVECEGHNTRSTWIHWDCSPLSYLVLDLLYVCTPASNDRHLEWWV